MDRRADSCTIAWYLLAMPTAQNLLDNLCVGRSSFAMYTEWQSILDGINVPLQNFNKQNKDFLLAGTVN